MGTYRLILLAVSALLLTSLANAAEQGIRSQEDGMAVEKIDRTLDTRNGAKLHLDVDVGSVSVDTWASSKVRVQVKKKADVLTEAEATALFEDFTVDIRQAGDDVHVRAESQKGRRTGSLNASFAVTVPTAYNVSLKTSGGSIKIADLEGTADATTAGGSIKVGLIKNGSVTVRTSGGSITIAGIGGGDGVAETAGGSIKIGDVTGDFTANTSGGKIQVGNVGGSLKAKTAGGGIKVDTGGKGVEVETSGGSIKIGDSQGAVTARTAGGSIKVGTSKGDVEVKTSGGSIKVAPTEGSVRASTAGGSIKIDGSGGPVYANTAGGSIKVLRAKGAIEANTAGGSIEAELIIADKDVDTHCSLVTAGGDLTIRLPAGLAAALDAEIEIKRRARRDYRIYSDFPIVTEGNGGRLVTGKGDINGGGDLIKLRTVDGDIRIKKLVE